MADSDGEFVADDGSDDELVAQPGSSYGTRAAASRGSGPGPGGGRSRAGGGGGGGGRRKKQPSKAKWEALQRGWEQVVEAEDGTLLVEGLLEAKKRKRLLRDTTPVQRGVIRHQVLVLDMSFAMAEKDLLPTRYRLTIAYAVEFVREYFEQNPISQLAVVGMRDGVAVRVSDMSGNPADHIGKIRALEGQDPIGNPSLQNALEMCRGALFNTPSHGTREVLIIFGALLSSDPGDIHDTIDRLVSERIRVSVIGLSAQVYICEELCRRTNLPDSSASSRAAALAAEDSTYWVAMDEVHFRELLLGATKPLATHAGHQQQQPSQGSGSASLLMMGFPSRTTASDPALCACHNKPARHGYACTRCGSRVCRLPAECPACGLTLILSTHLARSYHHLFPLRSWVEVPWSDAGRSAACFACLVPFPDARGKASGAVVREADKGKGKEKERAVAGSSGDREGRRRQGGGGVAANAGAAATSHPRRPPELLTGVSESGRYMCQVCRNHFCIDCDVFAHEVIHNCPGCQSDTRREPTAGANGEGVSGGTDPNGTMMVLDDP